MYTEHWVMNTDLGLLFSAAPSYLPPETRCDNRTSLATSSVLDGRTRHRCHANVIDAFSCSTRLERPSAVCPKPRVVCPKCRLRLPQIPAPSAQALSRWRCRWSFASRRIVCKKEIGKIVIGKERIASKNERVLGVKGAFEAGKG
jgi:hypothetical protein